MTPPVALGFGVVSMATNVTTLAIVVVAVKEVTASGDPVLDRAPALALLVVLASAPAWLPVLVTLPRGAPAASSSPSTTSSPGTAVR